MPVKLARSPAGGSGLLQPGAVLASKYRIERILGEGGMGTVYAAHHELLDQRVALKILFEDAMRDQEASARFLQEARSAARLQSEHVARVMDIDTFNGVPYIVMEYLEGADLGQYIERKRLFPPDTSVDYVLQALEAIAQAHAQGIVHRDLKPSNLFLASTQDGSQIIKVLDFGISKPTFGGKVSSLTSSRSVLGSPPYMSPEQVRSPRTVDTRTDIWSIGVLFYELLTGKMPFDGDQVGELFAAILEQEPRGIRTQRSDVPEGLERAIFRALAKKREQRYPDVSKLAKAIAPYGTGRQNKSLEKISQTLLRGEELSSPRRRAVAPSGVTPVARDAMNANVFDNTTIPDPSRAIRSDSTIPAPELSPTASTVDRRRTLFTMMGRSTRTKIYAFMGGGFTAVMVIALVVFVLTNRKRPVSAASPQPVALSAQTEPTSKADDPPNALGTAITPLPTVAGVATNTAAATGAAAVPPPTAKPIPKPIVARPPTNKSTAVAKTPQPATGKSGEGDLKKTLDVWK
jgi:serine/threonine-protein kinase